MVALLGLLGILVGEQVIPIAKRLLAQEAVNVGWIKSHCVPHIFGSLPTNATGNRKTTDQSGSAQ